MTPPTRIPAAALLLGLGGLIPFAVLSGLLVSGYGPRFGWPQESIRLALASYGAVIASFLGGVRWGVALRESGAAMAVDLGLAVVPSLLAWACLAEPSLVALAILIAAWGAVDQDLPRRDLAPAWFGRLRVILSVTAAVALAIGALA